MDNKEGNKMSSNRAVKQRLIDRYGAECFIERLKLRDTSGLKYTGKNQYKKMKMLTYHHIKEKSKGGKATIENGALLSAENHQWFHQQDRADREYMNNLFQDLKRNIDNNYEECKIENVPEKDITLPFDLNIMAVDIDTTGKIKPQKKAKKKYNRAKQKRKTNRIIKRYYGGER